MPHTLTLTDTAPAEAEAPVTSIDACSDAGDVEASNPHDAPSAAARLVPVTESIRYRKRAQAAEQQLSDAARRLKELQAELDRSRQTIDQLERRHRVDALLADADAVDLEAARLLTEAAVDMMDEPDVEAAVNDLRRAKPYLFRNRPAPAAQAMSAHERDDTTHPVTHAATHAATTGRRQDLLRYLRLRRSNA